MSMNGRVKLFFSFMQKSMLIIFSRHQESTKFNKGNDISIPEKLGVIMLPKSSGHRVRGIEQHDLVIINFRFLTSCLLQKCYRYFSCIDNLICLLYPLLFFPHDAHCITQYVNSTTQI